MLMLYLKLFNSIFHHIVKTLYYVMKLVYKRTNARTEVANYKSRQEKKKYMYNV